MNYRTAIVDSLVVRDGPLCQICQRSFTSESPPTIDHIIARSVGGPNTLSNLQLLHHICNLNKGSGISNKWIHDRKLKAITLHKEGMLPIDIANQLSLSTRTIYRYLSKSNTC